MSKFIYFYFYFFIYCQISFDDINVWYKELKENSNPGIKIVLVGNKCDKENRVVDNKEMQKIMDELDIDLYMETSAKTGKNVEKLFVEATKILYKEYMSLQKKMNKKEKTNKIILEETIENEENKSGSGICAC